MATILDMPVGYYTNLKPSSSADGLVLVHGMMQFRHYLPRTAILMGSQNNASLFRRNGQFRTHSRQQRGA